MFSKFRSRFQETYGEESGEVFLYTNLHQYLHQCRLPQCNIMLQITLCLATECYMEIQGETGLSIIWEQEVEGSNPFTPTIY